MRETNDAARPVSSKSTPDLPRVKPEELEKRYKDDPIVYNSINVTVQTIMSPGYRIVGKEDDVSAVYGFFDAIGSKGGDLEWEQLLTRIFQHQCIYGNAWSELIPNKERKKLVDLDLIDPKKMDYLRDQLRNIALDTYGNPVGYVETLPLTMTVESKLKPPEPYILYTNQIYIPPKRIVHYKFNTVGDGFDGIGLIEPIYRASVRREDAENAWSNSPLFPMLYAKVGDDQHEPTEQHIVSAMDELSKSSKRYIFSYPYWVDVGMLQATSPEKIVDQFKHFEDEVISGMGVPKAFAKWEGGETNRDTLSRQEYMFKLSLKNIIEKTCRTIEKNVFGTMREYGQIKTIPRFEWNEISLQELDSKANRIVEYIGSGALTPDAELERYIRRMEKLPPSVSGGK
jgi:hypothetical protein